MGEPLPCASKHSDEASIISNCQVLGTKWEPIPTMPPEDAFEVPAPARPDAVIPFDPSKSTTEQGLNPASPLTTQIGGNHYKDMPIQPIEYIIANNIPFAEGNVIKYVSRWRKKGGVADLKKARHMLDVIIEKYA